MAPGPIWIVALYFVGNKVFIQKKKKEEVMRFKESVAIWRKEKKIVTLRKVNIVIFAATTTFKIQLLFYIEIDFHYLIICAINE